ncbi:helix-turn-helix domain-containing protein [Burkholderia ubonensis]|uniref:helix-turn-helix domain-containing protein n=1 Tax=Burkholderia ubonensis TaxID=101571 RepID=UPI0012F79990|nr:helix-turn-helix transcriptional regulator [Burkholderia ubonensis]
MATPTRFGKELRKLRLDRGETMADLARALGKSPGFLSSVETGKKPVPEALVDQIVKHYELGNSASETLYEFARGNTGVIKIAPNDDKAYALVSALAKKLDSLSEDQQNKIIDILGNN